MFSTYAGVNPVKVNIPIQVMICDQSPGVLILTNSSYNYYLIRLILSAIVLTSSKNYFFNSASLPIV